MNEYDWNNNELFKNDPPKEEPFGADTPIGSPADSIGADVGYGPAPSEIDPLLEDLFPEQAVETEQPVGADAHIGPAPVETEQPVTDPDLKPEQPAYEDQPVYQEPSYQNYYYSSAPAYTARPDQSYRPESQPQTAAREIKAEKKRSGGFWKKAIALALVCCLLGGAAGFGGALLANRMNHKALPASSSNSGTAVQVAAPRETTDLSAVTVDSGKLTTASQVYKANVNSTVGITTEITTTNWWGYQSTAAAAGSGFILTEDGYILTNEHVIEKANTITVAMYDGTKYAATLIGYDTSNDIAVLKIDAKGLTPVTLGNSDALEVGEEVVAIGNPLGELTFSLTKGSVSALNRAVTLSSSVTMNLIQTDTAINSGNSGGALFNMYGEVVGITNAKYSSSGYSGEASIDNIGFAIPINSVRELVTSIIEKGYISTPYIGVTVGNVSEESQSYGMPQGAAIRSVEQGGPAEQAGLQANDIVTAIDGVTVTSYEDLKNKITASEPGDKLEFTIYRRGETLTLTVTVGEKTQSALPNQQSSQSQSGQSGQDGQGQYPWGGQGQSGQDGQTQIPWGDQGQSGQNGQDGQNGQSGQESEGYVDPWSWFWGSGSDSGDSSGSYGFPWG